MTYRIHSHDNITGTTSNGTWLSSKPLNNICDVIYQQIEPGDISWIYTDANSIQVSDSGGSTLVIFADDDESDKIVVAATMQVQLRAQLSASSTCTVTYNAVTDEFDIAVLDASTIFEWSDVLSTAKGVFNKTVDDPIGTTASWSAVYVDVRPPVIQMSITEAKNKTGGTNASFPTLYLSLDDEPILLQKAFFTDRPTTLTISLARTNTAYAILPTDLRWTVIMV